MKRSLFLLAAIAWAALTASAISPAELQAHVSFLASDALEGRDTPSKGLDIAAEYIASQMRRGGLQPAGPEGFFQTARLTQRRAQMEGFALEVEASGKTLSVDAAKARLGLGPALDLNAVAAFRWLLSEDLALLNGRAEPVLLVELPSDKSPAALRQLLVGLRKAQWTGKAVILLGPAPWLQSTSMGEAPLPATLLLSVTEEGFVDWAKALPAGPVDAKLRLKAAAPIEREIVAKNVIGLLEGSDPQLKDSYILLTAHYDHLGMRDGAADRVYNGANDNASGVASVLESAWWLHEARPRRSVLFIAFFGEERGLLGSSYYASHPVRPLAKSVANVNLEQTGRTDSSEGANVGMANLTGYHFTTIHEYFEKAGAKTGLKIVKHERFSDPFFMASDNAALAQVGIPSTTLSVTYQFPDYHQRGDEWEKLDYTNMALVTTTIAEAVKAIGDSGTSITWNEKEAKTAAFVEAARKLQAAPAATQP